MLRNWLKFRVYRLQWWFVGKTKWRTAAPIHVDVELASDCNLRCTMCPYGDEKHPYVQRGMMPNWMARNAIAEAGRSGVKSIKFQFRGEPGLNTHLEEHVAYASRFGFVDKFLNTNGLAFNAKRIAELLKAGITRIIISVDGATRETYERIRVRGDWDKLRRNVKEFISAGHKVTMQMTVQPENEHEVEQFKTLWPGAKINTKRIRHKGTVRAHCPQPYRRLIVAYDGTVFGCCNNWHNEFPVGDFKEETLSEIWRGKRMQELRNHAKCGTGPCKNCEIGEAWKK